ncbi:hypothetical protein ACEPAF_6268 [Sanghuangporus sanghuang]
MDEEHPLQDRGSEASMSLLKKVKRLKSKDIAQASRTLLDPAIPDPLSEYIRETPRPDEAGKTLFNLIRDAFGDDAKKMYHIAALATSPDLQGIGCDALVSAVLKVADAERRSASALAADPIHTEFFQYKGFECVAGTFIGKDEPTWDRPPVKISLMLRPYKEC